MPPYTTHLCLVSAQATPNLLPVLDPAWRPARVVLACSAQMREKAQALRAVLLTKSAGIRIDLLDLPNAYDYASLSDAFTDFLGEHEHEDIALNVTGGTKLMAVAAQEVFRANDKPVFYVNVENDEVLSIGRKGAGQHLRAQLKVHELLAAHGYQAQVPPHPQVRAELRDLTARLIDHVASAGWALGALNALARAARDTPDLAAQLTDRQTDSRALGEILSLLQQAGLARQAGKRLVFMNESARAFANGFWLEAHVFEVLQSLRSQHESITDVAIGVRVAFDGAGKAVARDMNEIDVAFLYRNTLHLIECKTANLAQPGAGDDDKATEAIYKMESLLKLGGLRTRGMVVDYRGSLSGSEANRRRAGQSGIEIVSGSQLKDIRGHISRVWLSASKVEGST